MEKRGRRYEWNEYFKVNDGDAMNRFLRTMENKLDEENEMNVESFENIMKICCWGMSEK